MEIKYELRQNKLRDIKGADIIAIVPGENMVYFTGLHFHLTERPIIALFGPGETTSFILPKLETPKIDQRLDIKARVFEWSDEEGYLPAFDEAVSELGLSGKTLGVDGMTMRVSEWLTFAAIDKTIQVKPVENDIIRIRAHKTDAEIELMRQACRASEAALQKLLANVKPGMTEREIAERLKVEIIAAGCDTLAFEPLVQTGPNSALPHGMLTSRELQAGEILLIDWGGSVSGYAADITRTFYVGTPPEEVQKMQLAVLEANRAAIAKIKPGVPMGDIDKAARDVIEKHGYGKYFIHRTGHGLGLGVHEPIPQIATGNPDLLEEGMTFTVEPGVYVPGLGGVRIEDNVAVTADGVEVLTSLARALNF